MTQIILSNYFSLQIHICPLFSLPVLLLCLFLLLSLSCQLVFMKKRKRERPLLCEEFMERASRPQELINIELLEVSREPRSTPTLTVDYYKYLVVFLLSFCRNWPTLISSTGSWRLLSLQIRPSTWSVKIWSLGSAALWWISTSGSKGGWVS